MITLPYTELQIDYSTNGFYTTLIAMNDTLNRVHGFMPYIYVDMFFHKIMCLLSLTLCSQVY